MVKSLKSVQKPETRFDVMRVVKYGEPVNVRIMLMKYDSLIEVYYQEEGHAFEFAFGIPETSITKALTLAQANAIVYLHYEEE